MRGNPLVLMEERTMGISTSWRKAIERFADMKQEGRGDDNILWHVA